MKAIQNIPTEICQRLKGIFCDLDDTLTTEGKLLDVSYHALWNIARSGLRTVVITGRPAGWADHIARMWPVDAVVGENGAFYFWMQKGKMHRFFVQDKKTREENRQKLQLIQQEILTKFPQAAISADQSYRESDLAIDFCEDIPRLDNQTIEQIMQIFRFHGAQVKISSIHINGWFGKFDKMSTCRLLLQNLWNESPPLPVSDYLYCGDSPTDEPMFASFAQSVGVANILPWLSHMKFHPTYQTQTKGGEGFAEMVDCVLHARQR